MEQRAVHFGPLVALFGQSKQTVVTLVAVPAAVTSGKKFRKYLIMARREKMAKRKKREKERDRFVVFFFIFAPARAETCASSSTFARLSAKN
jgi:hypothetical protein